MLLLLPPSEAKSTGGDGPPVDCDALVAPRLGATRRRVLTEVAGVSADEGAAAAALKLPPAVVEAALEANRSAATSPTRPALDRYTGVVYAGLDVPSMGPDVRGLAERSVLVFSGLFGIVRGSDLVPDYRVPVSATLPALGPLTPVWRAALRDAMPAVLRTSFAVDLRSTDYAGMWPPTGPLRHQVLGVRVLSPRPSGPPRVVSHFSKHGKGVLARALLEKAAAGAVPEDVDDVAAVATGLGWQVVQRRVTGGVPALDVVLPG
ncbi:hypothetical protein CLV35_2187 [Motilibacter peucedani]|uniref:Peroxide stress protein YaaA n=1 Tax=Motilibacter peucedani TaxID=598650 RepID=A0A420XR06_9ACTN|nr:peroxide stress protein YaaA [Motilibacter peucedani]RKS75710.1 hypothetical protein CLV35_2187 [Motilibacter peucedani]